MRLIDNKQIDVFGKFTPNERVSARNLDQQIRVVVRVITPDKTNLVFRQPVFCKALGGLVNQDRIRGDKQNTHTTTNQAGGDKRSQACFAASGRCVDHEGIVRLPGAPQHVKPTFLCKVRCDVKHCQPFLSSTLPGRNIPDLLPGYRVPVC